MIRQRALAWTMLVSSGKEGCADRAPSDLPLGAFLVVRLAARMRSA